MTDEIETPAFGDKLKATDEIHAPAFGDELDEPRPSTFSVVLTASGELGATSTGAYQPPDYSVTSWPPYGVTTALGPIYGSTAYHEPLIGRISADDVAERVARRLSDFKCDCEPPQPQRGFWVGMRSGLHFWGVLVALGWIAATMYPGYVAPEAVKDLGLAIAVLYWLVDVNFIRHNG